MNSQCEPFSLSPALSRWERENVRRVLAKPVRSAARKTSVESNSGYCGSLSHPPTLRFGAMQRERVRVRESAENF
jgi:hypothetical protein